MHPELTQFQNWLACQYPHSSVRKHYTSDLTLFFSYTGKPPSAITFHDVDEYIQHCLSQGLSPLTVNRRLSALRTFYYFISIVNDVSLPCPVVPRRHFLSRYCQSRLKTYGKKVNIHVAPHQLRHTCATLLLNAGMSIFALQSLLGHRHVDTTLNYARLYDETVARQFLDARAPGC